MTFFIKRGMDIAVSFVLLIVLSPIMLLTAIGVCLFLGYPAVFIQKRPGRLEKIFHIYKFRTMTNARDSLGELLPDELRLTAFGSFLRSTSLDELPQLWNVLKGDMSLVGPRPLLTKYLPYYRDRERKRFRVRPGITGLAQINGRNYLSWNERLELDVQYVETLSIREDIRILLTTVKKVVFHADVATPGVWQEPDLDMERMESEVTG
ncbi:sugar transferase [Paenibacillus sp. GCM10027629]|uniref:sugar transferase n=1 Tax=Paenibacillus sp. GCM10027629 TaxID=3273414 RepID=UPI003645DD0F